MEFLEATGRDQSAITLSKHKDYVSWNIRLVFDGQDEAEVIDRIGAIHRRLAAEYAPQDLEMLLAKSVAEKQK